MFVFSSNHLWCKYKNKSRKFQAFRDFSSNFGVGLLYHDLFSVEDVEALLRVVNSLALEVVVDIGLGAIVADSIDTGCTIIVTTD